MSILQIWVMNLVLLVNECQNTFAISYAINQALTQSGISIDKVHYRWKYITVSIQLVIFCSNNISNRVNQSTGEITDDTYWDELVVVVEVTDTNGNVVKLKHGTWTNGMTGIKRKRTQYK